MRLSHFSDDGGIAIFEPRPVRTPVARPEGQEWLNGPLVWAIDEPHQILYLFPRECPRILIWPTPLSTPQDRMTWMGAAKTRAVAYVETGWMTRLRNAAIWRYDMPTGSFIDTREVGMWVSTSAVRPDQVEPLSKLEDRLEDAGVELRALDCLASLKPVWRSSLHASGIRLRNAMDWGPPSWTHSKPGRVVQVGSPSPPSDRG